MWKFFKYLTAVIMLAVLLFPRGSRGSVLTDDDGSLYLSNQMVVGITKDCPKLAIGEVDSPGFTTGVASLDKLCHKYDVIKIEPWYKGKIRHAMHLKEVVERMYIFTIDDSKRDVRDLTGVFSKDNHLEYAELYSIPVPYYQPNDPNISQQWALEKINAYQAWDIIRGDTTKQVIIGISDTGIYYDHPDLEANMWINGPEDLNGDGIFENYDEFDGGDLNYYDDDGNGYNDDVVGYDFAEDDPDPEEDTPTHGTHVAGCASEVTDNEIGGAGIGFAAKLIAAKGANHNGVLTQVYQAITYSADMGASICNCSWGRGGSPNNWERNVVINAFLDGCLVIAAAGNDASGFHYYPATYDSVLSVAATDQNDVAAYFTNYGNWVDIDAPGVSIYSTWDHNSYIHLDGTSMASPITAGVAALVKAQDPSRGPQQISDILITTADSLSLYTANPDWIGLLGSGRVDAWAALAYFDMPYIRYIDSAVNIIDDDGDGILNPGESFTLTVAVQNMWADATNVNATLHSNENISVIDSTASFGDIPHNEQADNGSDPFTAEVNSNIPPGNIELTMEVTADGGYNTTLQLPIEVSLNQGGFPLSVDGNIEGHMAMINLDGNPGDEIVFGTSNDQIYVVKADGSTMSGFPVDVEGDIINGIAIGQVAGDSEPELVAATKSGNIYAINIDGTIVNGFPVNAGGSYYATPTLADIDGDGLMEIICPAFTDGKLYVYNGDGTAVSGFPIETGNHFYGSAAVGNIDNDGGNSLEIVAATLNGTLYAFNSDGSTVNGFPISVGSNIWVSPALGDLDYQNDDGKLEIAVGTQSGEVYAYNDDGSLLDGFPVNVGSTIKADPVIANVRYDCPGLEIVVATNGNNIYIIDKNGDVPAPYPIAIGGTVNSSPIIADVDNDGQKEILAAATDGKLYCLRAYGGSEVNFPIDTYGTITTSTPALGDIDGDNDLDIAVGLRQSEDNLVVIDYKKPISLHPEDWICYGYNIQRIHNWLGITVGVDDGTPDELPATFDLSQNYPNPFNAETNISYTLPFDAPVSFTIYNLTGKRVVQLVNAYQKAGKYNITWNGTNSRGISVSSGIYFYKLKAGEKTALRKMVLLK